MVHVVNVADTGGAQTLIEALVAHRPAGTYAGVVVLGAPGVLSGRLAAVADRVDHLGLDPATWRLDRLLRRVRIAVAAHRADVVHAHLLQSDLAVALLPGRPVRVSTVHTTGLGAGDRARSRGLARVMARLSRRFAYSVACSRQAEAYMAGAGYPPRHTVLIENGVALPGVRVARERPVFVSLSRWHPMKDHATLFRAFARVVGRHPRYELRCCGSGVTPDNRELTGLIARLGLEHHVELLGPVEEPGRVLQGADALVLSSAYGEALPMAGLEALALGVPVVATDVGDCARLCADPGLLAPPRDEVGLAEALMRVARLGPGERAALSVAARGIAAASFDIRRTVAAYYELYGKVRP
ncbi:glycosyltransferase [Dactylosporangium sp. CS-033363]|uniref:glycosyltransferase n=1 Tax=Dactylosporangium sp. CS-033363 TaxID=3239935 RepID=UPI003D8D253F